LVLVETVEEQDAVEVVELVLDHAGEELVGLEVDRGAVEVDPGDVDPLGPHDVPVQAGNREAALGELPLTVALADLGVDQLLPAVPLAEVVDEEALLDPHLRGGETDPGGV